MTRRFGLPLLCGLAIASPASAETLRAHYSISLVGLRIGDLYANGDLHPDNYKMDVRAHLTGLAAMVSNVKMALASSGALKKGNLAPNAYATSAINANETRTLRMALKAGTVKAVEISPPPEFRGERVPVTEANKRNILDPTSALIMPVPVRDDLVGPAACDRTLPIYDGYARFDIALHYVGQRDVAVAGYSGPVAVCSARYNPISGHLVNSRSTRLHGGKRRDRGVARADRARPCRGAAQGVDADDDRPARDRGVRVRRVGRRRADALRPRARHGQRPCVWWTWPRAPYCASESRDVRLPDRRGSRQRTGEPSACP